MSKPLFDMELIKRSMALARVGCTHASREAEQRTRDAVDAFSLAFRSSVPLLMKPFDPGPVIGKVKEVRRDKESVTFSYEPLVPCEFGGRRFEPHVVWRDCEWCNKGWRVSPLRGKVKCRCCDGTGVVYYEKEEGEKEMAQGRTRMADTGVTAADLVTECEEERADEAKEIVKRVLKKRLNELQFAKETYEALQLSYDELLAKDIAEIASSYDAQNFS